MFARETDWVTQFEGFFRALGWVVGYEKWVMLTEVSDSGPSPGVGPELGPETRSCSTRFARRRSTMEPAETTAICGACTQEMAVRAGHSHACKSPLHTQPVYLHAALVCDCVWQPLEDGDDSFCGRACVIAKNRHLLSEHAEALADWDGDGQPPPPPELIPLRGRAGDDVEMEALPPAATAKIPAAEIVEIWREESSKGRYSNAFLWGAEALLEAQAAQAAVAEASDVRV